MKNLIKIKGLIIQMVSPIFKLRPLAGALILFLIADYLLFRKFGGSYEDKSRIISLITTFTQFYLIIGFSNLLVSRLKKMKFYMSILLLFVVFAIDFFVCLKLKEISPSLRVAYATLDPLLGVLLLSSFALIIKRLLTIKALKIKRVLVVLAVLAGFSLFALHFNDIKTISLAFYQQTINPSAGVKHLEELYKDNFNGAQDALDETNFIVSDMQRYTKDINSLFAYQEKIRGMFSKREARFVEMLRIDEESKKLRVGQNYKEFYIKREAADQNDFEAFKIYREGMQRLMDGTLSYYKFSNLYVDAIKFIFVLTAPDGFTPENISRFDSLSVSLDAQYNEIASYSEKGIFTKELTQSMQNRNDNIKLFRDLNKAYTQNDKHEIDRITNLIQTRAKNNVTNEADLIIQWAKEKKQPVFEAQDEKHRKSLDLYNQAYLYAKNENINNILSVWGDELPGSTPEEKKVI